VPVLQRWTAHAGYKDGPASKATKAVLAVGTMADSDVAKSLDAFFEEYCRGRPGDPQSGVKRVSLAGSLDRVSASSGWVGVDVGMK
jgi:hypothetical protein